MNELKQFQEEQHKLNELRNTDYKKLKEIMNEYCGFTNLMTQKEPNYINLWAINNFIEDFEAKVIQSTGERKTSAEKHLKTLYLIQQQYGKYYFESIIYRQKVQELETNQIIFMERIKQLESKIKLLNNLKEF
jgi:ssDNA-specific exonuclease RecJ